MGSMTTCSRPMPSWSTLIRPATRSICSAFPAAPIPCGCWRGSFIKSGLITPEQVNLAGSGLIAYKQFSSDEAPKLRASFKSAIDVATAEDALPQSAFDNAAQFARITSSRWPTIRFVGVWDTVASVIVPRADRFYLAEPGGAGVHACEPERADVPAGDLDRRAALHVPPEEVGRPADLQAQPLQRRACRAAGYFAGVVRRRACRYRRRLSGKGKRACRNIRCCG